MSLLYNSFRAQRYLRTRFEESRYLLAQEASDMELEMIDLIKENLTNGFGATFFDGTALQVTNPSSTSLLVTPGEAWFNGLPFVLKAQGDEEWSIGNTPGGFTLVYTNTAGLQVNFNSASFSAGTYTLVVGCQEQVVTAPNDNLSTVHDPFLQNPNLATPTAEKVRLIYSINLVTASNQTATPVPYTSQTGPYSAVNLTNYITLTPAGGTTDGTVIAQSALSSKSEVDGSSYTVTVYNTTGSFPTANADLANFANGTFVDSLGNSFHLVSVQVNSTPANSILLTLDQEIGQNAPVITNGVAYTLYKQNVYYTTQDTGIPTGFQFLPLANIVWSGTAITSITDLRTNNYSSNVRGTATDNVVTRIGHLTADSGDEQEDRSAYLYTSSVLSWSGTQLSGTTTIPLTIINSAIGGTTTHNITILNPQTLTNGDIYYVTINRTLSSETLSLTTAASLPAQTQTTKNIIPIFQVTGTTLLIPLHKQTILTGTSFTLGNTGSGVTSIGTFGSSPNSGGASISGTVLTLQPASGTEPGGVSTTTQTFAGNKTINGTLTLNNGSNSTLSSTSTGLQLGGGGSGTIFPNAFAGAGIYSGNTPGILDLQFSGSDTSKFSLFAANTQTSQPQFFARGTFAVNFTGEVLSSVTISANEGFSTSITLVTYPTVVVEAQTFTLSFDLPFSNGVPTVFYRIVGEGDTGYSSIAINDEASITTTALTFQTNGAASYPSSSTIYVHVIAIGYITS